MPAAGRLQILDFSPSSAKIEFLTEPLPEGLTFRMWFQRILSGKEEEKASEKPRKDPFPDPPSRVEESEFTRWQRRERSIAGAAHGEPPVEAPAPKSPSPANTTTTSGFTEFYSLRKPKAPLSEAISPAPPESIRSGNADPANWMGPVPVERIPGGGSVKDGAGNVPLADFLGLPSASRNAPLERRVPRAGDSPLSGQQPAIGTPAAPAHLKPRRQSGRVAAVQRPPLPIKLGPWKQWLLMGAVALSTAAAVILAAKIFSG
jgi:hypothetical protein